VLPGDDKEESKTEEVLSAVGTLVVVVVVASGIMVGAVAVAVSGISLEVKASKLLPETEESSTLRFF
jgi:hypothetical protein